MLELHCHTTCSDGTLTPRQLVETAIAAGVKALAITDHDTLSGWDEAVQAAMALKTRGCDGLEIVPGVELSTVHGDRSMHILGYYPNRDQLLPILHERLASRKRRAIAMQEKLAALGYPIELPQMGHGMAPGRPHVAAAMVQAGYVKSSQEAFDRFLVSGKPAYVSYEPFAAVEGIRVLRDCGAVPVWAHPYLFRGGEVTQVLPDLLAAGLMGIEVYHPSHTPNQIETLRWLCQKHNLLITGGSDYHGPTPDPKGKHAPLLNGFNLPLDLLVPLQRASSQSENC
ncbi:MAG TPA: PHP domain-containing protein [Synechococcales cyanobacterium M55_K2018_004]|nr:PHP domain-containing protein [Synechococcales cyanobacterium M55_K2018_004]